MDFQKLGNATLNFLLACKYGK